jgi:NADH-quinone oxidoreductase subunit L
VEHAFFKALLFLGVGIVIHSLAGQQSLDRMGGLRRHLPLANVTVLVGCLAIAGIPPFSGFFSKDEILETALEAGSLGVTFAIVGLVAAAITTFYMFRLYFRTFWGPEPESGYDVATPRPSRWPMSVPVVALAVLTAVGGLIQVPSGWHLVDDWLEPVVPVDPLLEPTTTGEVVVGVVSTLLGVAAIALAWWLFVADPGRRTRLAGALPRTRELLADQYRFDEVYEEAVVQPGRDVGDTLTSDVEGPAVEGALVGAARALTDAGRGLRAAQTGLVRTYAFAMVAGAAVVGVVFVLALR